MRGNREKTKETTYSMLGLWRRPHVQIFPHEVEKVRIVHNVQQAATIEDMRRNVP
jgi:hypothetical protein